MLTGVSNAISNDVDESIVTASPTVVVGIMPTGEIEKGLLTMGVVE